MTISAVWIFVTINLPLQASQRGVKMIALCCELVPDTQGKEAVVIFNGLAPIDLSYKKPVVTDLDGTKKGGNKIKTA